MTGRVTIAIPYYRHPDSIGQCVQSALAQTYQDVRVVVIGDGEAPPPLGIQDERLVVYTLGRNHGGAPFPQQVALLATPDEWYAPLGADDWLEPTHIEELMAMGSEAVATGRVWYQRKWPTAICRQFIRDVRYEVGLFKVERLRAIGGYDPSERVAQDNLILDLLEVYGGLAIRRGPPTYHRVQRYLDGGGVSVSAETGAGSEIRQAANLRNAKMLQKALKTDLDSFRSWRTGRWSEELTGELYREVMGLERWMP